MGRVAIANNQSRPQFSSSAVKQSIVLTILFCGFFADFLYRQARYATDPDWSHSAMVPLISLWFIWVNRERIASLSRGRNLLGIPLMLFGMLVYFLFSLSTIANHTVQGAGMILCLLGLVLFLFGRKVWFALLFPQLYLSLGVTVSNRALGLITPTLQTWAARGSYILLNAVGYQTEISGNVLTVFHKGAEHPLNVAEACSGMRMIVGFIALGTAVAFLSCKNWWQRIILVALAIPIAVFVNILRVATLGVLSTVDAQWISGDAHIYIGMLWLIPAFVVYMGVVWVLHHIIIEDPDSEKQSSNQSNVQDNTPTTDTKKRKRRTILPVITVAFILGSGVGAFHVAKYWIGAVLHKEAVPLRHPLHELPRTVGKWKRTGADLILPAEFIEELGTSNYLSRRYAIDGDVANGVLDFHVAYYTGMVDAVPHIPERCLVGNGLEKAPLSSVYVLDLDQMHWEVDAAYTPDIDPETDDDGPYILALSQHATMVRMPRFNNGKLELNISEYWSPDAPDNRFAAGYFFLTNGWAVPYAGSVKTRAFQLTDRYAYYCKVQLTYARNNEPVSAEDLAVYAAEFMDDMLPEIMWCLPDWYEVEQQEDQDSERIDDEQ